MLCVQSARPTKLGRHVVFDFSELVPVVHEFVTYEATFLDTTPTRPSPPRAVDTRGARRAVEENDDRLLLASDLVQAVAVGGCRPRHRRLRDGAVGGVGELQLRPLDVVLQHLTSQHNEVYVPFVTARHAVNN